MLLGKPVLKVTSFKYLASQVPDRRVLLFHSGEPQLQQSSYNTWGNEKFLCISETSNAGNQLKPEPLANMRKIPIHSQKAGENSVGFGDLTTLPCVKINIEVSHQIQTQPNRFTYWGLGLLLRDLNNVLIDVDCNIQLNKGKELSHSENLC